MGWEQRNGQHYYYRKIRSGRSVHSEYWGRGESARIACELFSKDPTDQAIDFQLKCDKRAYEESFVQRIEESEREIMRYVCQGLRNCGFHMHKGQWRKRREEA